jgi:hypothetical protein
MCGGYAGALSKKGDRADPRWFGIWGFAWVRRMNVLRRDGEQTIEQAEQRTQESLSETKGENCEMEGR